MHLHAWLSYCDSDHLWRVGTTETPLDPLMVHRDHLLCMSGSVVQMQPETVSETVNFKIFLGSMPSLGTVPRTRISPLYEKVLY
jgi:hypothetical protein